MHFVTLVAILGLLVPFQALAGGGSEVNNTHLLMIAMILVISSVSSFVARLGVPTVLGEILTGIVLGNLSLFGLTLFEPMKSSEIISFLAELGAILLLFQVGLESNISDIRRVGRDAVLVAVVGVAIPLIAGIGLASVFFSNESPHMPLFLGATLTATSIGISSRLFKDLGVLNSKSATIVLGAAVIDDVLGLIILALVSGIVVTGSFSAASLGLITLKAILFLTLGVYIGSIASKFLGRVLSQINSGAGMKLVFVLSVCMIFSYLASLMGLAPIIGAFVAGIMLDDVHFRHFDEPSLVSDLRSILRDSPSSVSATIESRIQRYASKDVEHLIEPFGHFLTPIFFVTTGAAVRLDSISDPMLLLIIGALTLVALVSKLGAGFVSSAGNKLIIGWGMVPRGEVGFIFAATALGLGAFSPTVYSVVVIVVLLTTLISPVFLGSLVRSNKEKGRI